jgi:hypothetical protein
MGFDGRIFLHDYEHETYLRRMPVRYIRHKLPDCCAVCGKPSEIGNPLQASHLIPFIKGVRQFKLTPEFLDRKENIVSAHRLACNKSAELSDAQIVAYLASLK